MLSVSTRTGHSAPSGVKCFAEHASFNRTKVTKTHNTHLPGSANGLHSQIRTALVLGVLQCPFSR